MASLGSKELRGALHRWGPLTVLVVTPTSLYFQYNNQAQVCYHKYNTKSDMGILAKGGVSVSVRLASTQT